MWRPLPEKRGEEDAFSDLESATRKDSSEGMLQRRRQTLCYSRVSFRYGAEGILRQRESQIPAFSPVLGCFSRDGKNTQVFCPCEWKSAIGEGKGRREVRNVRKMALTLVMALVMALLFGLMGTPRTVAYMTGPENDQPVHEYIAEQALALYSNDEIAAYFGQIRHGAAHEDQKDHVYDRTLACTTYTHFWDADKALDDAVDSSPFCADGENAWQKAQKLWGMAVGEYASGDKDAAYEYLGHIAHLLADMTVPAHAHEDMHGPQIVEDDCYEDWMTRANAELNQPETEWLSSVGPFEIPDWASDPLFYLFYTTNQIGDFFPSDDYDGDTDDNWGGWMDEIYSGLDMYSITKPRTSAHLSDNDDGDNNDDGDLSVIRHYCLLHAIRATAALYELFAETVGRNSALTVVIESISAQTVHDDFPSPWPEAEFYVVVRINGFWFVNRGNKEEDEDDVSPGWAFARDVGLAGGSAEVTIQLWDDDSTTIPPVDAREESDIASMGDNKDLDLTVNLSTGAISGDVTGRCGVTLMSEGTEDECSKIWFRILIPDFHDVEVILSPPILAVEPGDTATYTIWVKNLGNVNDAYELSLGALDYFKESWTSLWPRVFWDLDPGETDRGWLEIRIPTDWGRLGLDSATDDFTVTATCLAEPTVQKEVTGALTINILDRELSVDLSGELDYLWLEDVRIRLAALVTDVNTMEPVSNADVAIEICQPDGTLWIADTMDEDDPGCYTWQSERTIHEYIRGARGLEIQKGVYLVYVHASYEGGPTATKTLEFHLDPPAELSNVVIYSVVAVIMAAAAILLLGRQLLHRPFRKLKLR